MTASPGKRILKWAVLTAPWLLAFILAAGWALSIWTPRYLEGLIPRLAADMGVTLDEFRIRNAGLFSADMGPVRLGTREAGVQVQAIRVTYTPALLKLGNVHSVQLSGVTLPCSFDGTSISVPALKLLPTSSQATSNAAPTLPDLPFDSLIIEDSTLLCTFMGRSLSIPFSATITPGQSIHFDGTLFPRDQQVSFTGSLGPTLDTLSITVRARDFQLGALADLGPMPITGNADLDAAVRVNLSHPEMAQGTMRTTLANVEIPDTRVALAPESPIKITATLHDKSLEFSLEPVQIAAPYPAVVSIPKGHAAQDSLTADFRLDAANISLPGTITAHKNADSWGISLTAANPSQLEFTTGGRTLKMGGLDLSMTGTVAADSTDLTLKGTTNTISIKGTPVRSGAVSFSLPLAWPPPARHTPGSLRISGLRYDAYKLGRLSATMRQEAMGVAFQGALLSQLLPDFLVRLSGSASMESRDATLRFAVDNYPVPQEFNPSSLSPALKNLRVSGALALEGGIVIHEGDIASRLGLFFTDGTLTVGPEGATKASGVRLYFESPDLFNFHSAPAQMLAFESLRAGPVTLGKGVITFQLEPGGVTLVERLGFDWVGGRVASRAFRIVPGHDEYDVTLFCSRLRLSSLLGQLGLAEAKGEAELSGELPVTWKHGKISFNDGFLHSTPGQGGTIQVKAMQDLLSAIPEGTPQRGQLELAQAAIRDFQYKWVRVKADTVGEDLLVRLSLDGKPTGPLPFVYRKEFGGFARVTGDVQGSNFQGLQLDVNFTLPLDRILLYKDIIDMIE